MDEDLVEGRLGVVEVPEVDATFEARAQDRLGLGLLVARDWR